MASASRNRVARTAMGLLATPELCHQGDGVAETLAEPDQAAVTAGEKRLAAGTPLHERIAADVAPLELHQVESIDAQRRLSDREQLGSEVGSPLRVASYQLAVDDARPGRQREDCRSDV